MKRHIAIILPCYNEEKIISHSLRSLTDFLETQIEQQWTIVCVNDGSSDTTASKIREFQKEYQNTIVTVHFVDKTHNEGKGAAIQAGVEAVRADWYGYMDADVSIDFQIALPTFVSAMDSSDMLIAERTTMQKEYSWFRRLSSRFMTFFPRWFFRLSFSDPQCGFKFFHHSLLPLVSAVRQSRFSFDIELLVRVQMQGKNIRSIPVTWQHRTETSVRLRDGVRYLIDLFPIMEVAYSWRTFLRLYVLMAFFITIIVYGWTVVYGYFFSDDFTWLWHGAKILRGEIGIMAHMSTFFSPVINVFYTLFYTLFSYHASVYFGFGLLVHVLTAVMVGVLTRYLSRSQLAGFIAVVLFSFAGSAYEPLVWVGANMHSVAAMFIVLSVLSLVLFFEKPKSRFLSLFTTVLALLFALGTKEIAVALPPILLYVSWWYLRDKKVRQETWKLFFVAIIVSAVPLFWYVYSQYIWQKSSVWVGSGAFSLSVERLYGLPIVLMDMVFPLAQFLRSHTAMSYALLALGLLVALLYRFRQNATVWFGFIWAVMAVMPVLFFNHLHWWDVLPSRYTYTARIGIVMMIAVILVQLLQQGKYLRLVHRLFWVILIFILYNTIHTAHIISTQYAYVYETGRALTKVSEELATIQPEKVVVEWYRPFEKNVAHIIGAFDVIAGIPEDRVEFLEKDELYEPKEGEVVVRWNDGDMRYHLLR